MKHYPNGYQPKIDYWQYKMNKAIGLNDTKGIEYAAGKLNYFINRQLALQGETIA